MDRQRWEQIDPILKSALARPEAEREAFLREACGGDEGLRREVASLVAHEAGAGFLDAPAFDEAARLLAEQGAAARAGQTLGGYRVVEQIGAGGMGEVYLAVQTKTGRRVALKLLPAHLSSDEQRVRRFRQEARAVLALNHPNIVTVYDIEEVDGAHLIASELIEGETLRRRMARAPLGVVEALDVAAQAASALAAAHEAGVVHRDIKPENVMLRPDGYVKVLDFGLAKLTERPGPSAGSSAPALGLVETGPGVVMGTVAYMSPEQARGLEVDARTDVWSLGVVLYEMLAGRTPFAGETGSDVLAAILQQEAPPLGRHRPGAGESLEWLVAKALTKDREGRYQTARELAADLKRLRRRLELRAEAGESGAVSGAAETTGGADRAAATAATPPAASSAEFIYGRLARHRRALFAGLALALCALAGAGYLLSRRAGRARPAPDFRAMQVRQLTDTGQAADAAVSPDGEFVAYVKAEGGRQSLWLRQTSAASSVEVAPPAEGQHFGAPLFSPDGAYIYYLKSPPHTARAALYRVPKLGGGAAAKVADDISLQDTRNNFALSPDGRRLAFVRLDEGYKRTLVVADARGGDARPLHTVALPQFLSGAAWSPDGRTLATVKGTFVGPKVVLAVSVEGGAAREVGRQWNNIAGLAWLHDSEGLVLAAADRGDLHQLWQLSYPAGEVRRITNDVNSYVSVSVTADSSALAAVAATEVMNVWTAAPSRPGREAETAQLTFGAGRFDGHRGLAWTPDGRIVYPSLAGGNPDIWVMNADGTGQRQLTDGGGQAGNPSVTPDGRYLFYVSTRGDEVSLVRADLDGSDPRVMAKNASMPSVSPDGRWVFYYRSGHGSLWKVPVEGGEPVQVPKPERDLAGRPVVSPDGRLLACNYLVHGPNAVFRIALLPAEGGVPLKIFDVVGPPIRTLQWTPDGRALTYVETRGGVSNVVRLPLDGGPAAPLTDFKADSIEAFAWSPDGRRLALARASSTSSVVLIGGFR